MLIGNYNVQSKHPGRNIGGGATGLGYHFGQFGKASRGAFTGSEWEGKSGVPDGYRPPYTWIIPIDPGGLSARNNTIGTGSFVGAVAGGKNATATLAGTGALSGTAALIVSLVAALSGSGTISSAALLAYLNLAATLAGEGDADGTLTAIGHALATLEGDGDADATATAKGTLAAAITVTGDLLTSSNIADAILDDPNSVEAGLTVRQALRIIAAAVAGEVSGAETSTITFRNAVADDTSRIIATVSSGNRTAITYDLD